MKATPTAIISVSRYIRILSKYKRISGITVTSMPVPAILNLVADVRIRFKQDLSHRNTQL